MKLDIKTIFILVLGAALVLMFIFKGSKNVDINKDEINRLNLINDSLINTNKELQNSNDSLNVQLVEIQEDISVVSNKIALSRREIQNLEDGKDKISGNVRKLNADGVAIELSNYLNRRESKSND